MMLFIMCKVISLYQVKPILILLNKINFYTMKILQLIISILILSNTSFAQQPKQKIAKTDTSFLANVLAKLLDTNYIDFKTVLDSNKNGNSDKRNVILDYMNQSDSIIDVQNSIINILEGGTKWFEKNIGKVTTNDATAIYYEATPVNNLFAQQYYGQKLSQNNSLYYAFTYTTPQALSLAVKAIDELPALKNSQWMILKSINNNSYETQKLFLNGIDIGYTTYLKIIGRFEIFLKNNGKK